MLSPFVPWHLAFISTCYSLSPLQLSHINNTSGTIMSHSAVPIPILTIQSWWYVAEWQNSLRSNYRLASLAKLAVGPALTLQSFCDVLIACSWDGNTKLFRYRRCWHFRVPIDQKGVLKHKEADSLSECAVNDKNFDIGLHTNISQTKSCQWGEKQLPSKMNKCELEHDCQYKVSTPLKAKFIASHELRTE